MNEPFTQHPNLSPEINAAIIKSEIDGGAYIKDLPGGKALKVTTMSRVYVIRKLGDNLYIQGHPTYCPWATKAYIHGSTFGGSTIKIDYVGRNMYLEFSTDEHPRAVVTSQIIDVKEIT